MPVPVPQHYQTRLVPSLATANSPEHLLLEAIGRSLLTTFEAFAARDRVELLAWEARVGGMVEGSEFTSYQVDLDHEVSDVDKARAMLDEVKQHCLITNALRAPVAIDARIRPAVRKAG